MSAFSWRCQYCSWAFQMSSDAVASALATADASQARHHVEHCPRCRKALKIPVDQLRHHAPLSASAPIRSLPFQEDKKPMSDIPAPFPPVEPAAPAPAPVELPTPVPAAPKPVVKPAVKKVVKKAKKTVKKAVKKPVKKVKKAVKKPVKKAKKVVKKAAKKKSKK